LYNKVGVCKTVAGFSLSFNKETSKSSFNKLVLCNKRWSIAENSNSLKIFETNEKGEQKYRQEKNKKQKGKAKVISWK
jgi:hypothetical protein